MLLHNANSYGQQFLADEMKSDHLQTAAIPEMALHGLADIPAKFVKRFGLGKDRVSEGSGTEP